MKTGRRIIPHLWYDGKAEEAAEFYISVFGNGRVVDIMRNGDAGPGPRTIWARHGRDDEDGQVRH